VRSILEENGLRAGTDLFLAFSPERVDPGNKKWTTKNVPKVVGCLTPDCSALAAAPYGASIDQVVQKFRYVLVVAHPDDEVIWSLVRCINARVF
jgi:UDP-N-acetyl-D-mannosaminuronate dehydrogenase